MLTKTAFALLAASWLLPPAPAHPAGGVPAGAQRRFEFVTPSLDSSGRTTRREAREARGFAEDLGGGVTLEMVEVPAGAFVMGSPEGEDTWDEGDEKVRHPVAVPRFFMGRYEVTQAQYRAVMGELPYDESEGWGDDSPVVQVPWEKAAEFCRRLSKKTGRAYRLPSEAEWEYAARAGTHGPFAFGETVTPDFVNYNGEEPYGRAPKGRNRQDTVRVGSLGAANAFGLYDMHGNAAEWCQDWWHQTYEGAPADGSAWTEGRDMEARVIRGGSWFDSANSCRSAARDRISPTVCDPTIGFRVAASAGKVGARSDDAGRP